MLRAAAIAGLVLLALGSHLNGGAAASVDEPAAATLHVSSSAAAGPASASDGSAASPYRSLQAAKDHIIRQHTRDGASSIRHIQIHPGTYSAVSIDHPALSGTSWRGAGRNLTTVSGGIEIPRERFKPWSEVSGAYVASIAGLGADSLGAMIGGNEVADCQSDKVGLSFGGDAMTNARWPNQVEPVDETAPWAWSHAKGGCKPARGVAARGGSTLTMDTNEDPDALRLLKWGEEADAWVHGYWEWCGKKRLLLRRFLNETPSFAKTGSGQAYGKLRNKMRFCRDWGDAFAPVSSVQRRGDTVELSYKDAPMCKPNARWMGVNLLCELDAPVWKTKRPCLNCNCLCVCVSRACLGKSLCFIVL